jgi:serine/threonine protein kinase/Tol biopolymer transport system component
MVPLSSGTRLGVYEIVAPIGAGGMGEVYRARDARLERDVAIKVLPASFATDPDALARFDREMKTLAVIPHPHILAIYDVGREGSTAYAVTELLEGETLAEVVARGPIPIRKATEYGVQIARALAAAHDRGIVHRDLKPANVMLTSDGHVKVLDFGLARSTTTADDAATKATTTPGLVMGTVGYMSPEQARGLPADHRTDVFAFGCVMYELMSGRRAFERSSAADTLSAILKEDPAPLAGPTLAVPPALERVVQRCLEKEPAERFQSARDLAFALDALSFGATGPPSGQAAAPWPRRTNALAGAAVAAVAAAFVLGQVLAPSEPIPPPTITRLTFERGVIRTARFAPDAETIVYGASWNGAPLKIFVARADTAESKPLDLPSGDIVAVSKTGDMLLSLGRRFLTSWTAEGTLASARLFGSSARELLEHVRDADFLPGDRLAIVRRVDGRDRLEVPQGTVVFDTAGYISHVRVSPDGQRVGFLEHPLFGDNRGYVAVYDGKAARRLTPEYTGLEALAWSADGREIWYCGATTESNWPIRAIDADTVEPRDGRIVWYVPHDLLVLDIDARGRVLLTGNATGGVTQGAVGGDVRDRDFTWSGWTVPGHVSRDGRTLILSSQDGADPDYSVLVQRLDGSAPVKVGRGRAQALSPDGTWALSITPSEPNRVLLSPTGPGDSRQLDVGDLIPRVGMFVPPALTVAVVGTRNGSPAVAVVDVPAGTRTMLDLPELRGRPFGIRRHLGTHVSPDGSVLATMTDDGEVLAWPLPGGGPSRELAALGPNEMFAGWSSDPARILVAAWNGPTARIDSLDLTTGQRKSMREITVADPAGMLTVPDLYISADAQTYVYGYTRMLSTLYLVTDLR